ncbi:MAG: hypothetical protein V2I33_09840 [Kangiellaceae bacterium]|jgi:hypothetical protein|nr:hypothetical protein [Kangiellaceae bacterium]
MSSSNNKCTHCGLTFSYKGVAEKANVKQVYCCYGCFNAASMLKNIMQSQTTCPTIKVS